MEDILRYATYEDMDLLFQWANDTEVRNNSFSSARITYEEHKEWYGKLMERKDARQYIFLHDGAAVGQIRIETEAGIGTISYSICKEYRGMGYGTKILQLLAEQVPKDFPGLCKLQGKVKKENVKSQSAFKRAGFETAYQLYELPLEKVNKMI